MLFSYLYMMIFKLLFVLGLPYTETCFPTAALTVLWWLDSAGNTPVLWLQLGSTSTASAQSLQCSPITSRRGVVKILAGDLDRRIDPN